MRRSLYIFIYAYIHIHAFGYQTLAVKAVLPGVDLDGLTIATLPAGVLATPCDPQPLRQVT